MKAKSRSRFDRHALKALAGDRAFSRGEAYFRDGMVEILDNEPTRVLARVTGAEDYRIVVAGQGTAIDGECSCPAFERERFCKHIVAVALAANGAAAGETDGGGTLSRVRAYLKTWDIDALIELIMDRAEREPALLRKLEIAATAAGTDGEALESRLRSALREATRTRGFVDYGRAASWAAGVGTVLDILADLAAGSHAKRVVALADYALRRIERALEGVDDSDGHGGALLAQAQRIHLLACQTARPAPLLLARDLFLRETEGEYDTFDAAAAQYADLLGEGGLAEYRRLAWEAWERQLAGDVDFRLLRILDFFAEREGDVEMRIALRAKNLSLPWAYFQLAEFCREQGREEEALRRAEEGLWLFEDDRPDERLIHLAVDLLLKANRKADAEGHLWRAFKKVPSLHLYARLRELGGRAAAERVIDYLRETLAEVSATRWHSPADLLIQVMIEEGMFEAAWAIIGSHRASQAVKEALARASETTHARKALAVYAERVEELVGAGGNSAYQEAAAMIARMGGLRGAAEQSAYLSDLRMRHRRRRNFMKLLE